MFRGDVADDGIAWFLWFFPDSSSGLPQQQIGDVDVRFSVLGGGVLFEIVGYADVEAAGGGEFLFPFFVAVNVGKGDDFSTSEDAELVSELSLAAGGEPDV